MILPTKQKEEKNKRWEISTTSYNGRWLVMNVGCIKKDVSIEQPTIYFNRLLFVFCGSVFMWILTKDQVKENVEFKKG